ncbi:MAG: insulinase family protein [Bacteroidaceae bacterium]|nr:insulinase family protein [Bacteroidaceae bacterium]
MKKLILSIALVSTVLSTAFAQQMQLPQLSLDPAVKMGRLPNGLTYYIRHNEWPEQRANFYIAQKVGSMQEDDNQRGLAHFLEHMCFNGTTHFPGNSLKTYLESIGVKFGENLNAYTSFDETVYNINNVPVISNPQAIDSCLLILHDWSHDLLLEDTEIDKERGVINEEWRMRSSATQRMYEKALPTLYEGSKYAHRMPIGTMDIVMNFPYDDIRNYYRKWYRPDLQAIIIVGDVDVDAVETKIKTIFADIQAPAPDAAVREYYTVPDNAEVIYSLQTDKEQQRSQLYVMWKHDAMEREMKNTAMAYMQSYIIGAINGMLSTRMAEILMRQDPPFTGAQISFNEEYLVANTKDACILVTSFKDGQHAPALAAAYRELLRAKRHGFTVTEYERFKESYKASIENMYQRRDKISNDSYVNEYVRHFLDNDAAPGIEWEHTTLPQLADQISLDVINQVVMQPEECAPVIFAMMPDKADITYPTKDEIVKIMTEVEAEEIEAYKEEVSDEPILDTASLRGSKVKKTKPADFGFTHITLKNGINIYLRHTDFSPNNISMTAMSWGGNSLYPDTDLLDADNAESISLGGWGNYSAIDLSKKLAGINARVSPSIGTRSESMSGSCVKKDFETMLQLTYLAFTSPRRDDEAFRSTMARTKTALANAELDPTTALSDTIKHVVYRDNPRVARTKSEDIDRINYDHMLQIYNERFADADDFTFFFIGDIDIEAAIPMLEQYIGSLPVKKGSEKYKPIDLTITKGTITNVFEKEQETPNAIVAFIYHAPMEENLKNILSVSFLQQALQMLFTETVREDEGGAYSVGVSGNISTYPEKIALMQVQLPTAPDKRQRMTQVIYQGIENMCQNGPTDDQMQKIREYMLRSHDESIKTNGYWMGAITNKVMENKNYVDGYEAAVNALTATDVQTMARTIFQSGNRIEVGMTSPLQ